MELLLLVEGTLTPCCSKSHIIYVVYLPGECRKLHVDFSYEPSFLEDKNEAREIIHRTLERFVPEEDLQHHIDNWEGYLPLKNLVTLSFDDAFTFRGCAHRHDDNQQLIISEEGASPGLIPGVIPSGQFRITLSAHAVVTAACHYRLKVWEGEEILD